MKSKIACLLAGIVAFSAASMSAQDKPQNRPSREEQRQKWKDLSPEEREAKMKEFREKHPEAPGAAGERFREEMRETAKQLGLDPEKMKDLTPEERRNQFREAADKKTAELKAKKEKGTLTEDDKKLLEKLDNMKKRADEFRQRQCRGEGPGDRRDARKPEAADKK